MDETLERYFNDVFSVWNTSLDTMERFRIGKIRAFDYIYI